MTEEKLARAQEILSKIKILRSVPRETCEIVGDDVEKLLENKLRALEAEFKEL